MDPRRRTSAYRRIFRKRGYDDRRYRTDEFRNPEFELASLIGENFHRRADRRLENPIEEFFDGRRHRQRIFQEDLRRELAKHLERNFQLDVDRLSERVLYYGVFCHSLRLEHRNQQLFGWHLTEQQRRVLFDAHGRHEFGRYFMRRGLDKLFREKLQRMNFRQNHALVQITKRLTNSIP